MLKTSLTFHNQFQSLHFSRANEPHQFRPRKKSDTLGKNDLGIKHTESIGGIPGDLGDVAMIESIKPNSAKPQKDSIEEDLMYISLEEKRSSAFSNLKPSSLQHGVSPQAKSSKTNSPSPSPAKKKVITKQSVV